MAKVSLDYAFAQTVLLDALAIAKSGSSLPVEWISHSRSIFALTAKTWTPAFATMLLAKATDASLDAMSLKVEPGASGAYSARNLCHKVIVPAASEHQFSIRNTGREPMNNQPFFRYSRVDGLERVRDPRDRDFFVDVSRQVNLLDSNEALSALAAFLKVALEVASQVRNVRVRVDGLTQDGARVASVDYLRADTRDRPQRLQAFGAACLSLVFPDVVTRRINDPSRDFPGDVHVRDDDFIALAMEVRGKPITHSDLANFVREVSAADIRRAIMFVDSSAQTLLNIGHETKDAARNGVQLAVYVSVTELLGDTFLWSNVPGGKIAEQFSQQMLAKLREIEVSVTSLEEWARAVAIAQSR